LKKWRRDLRLGPETQHAEPRESLNRVSADAEAIKVPDQGSDRAYQPYKKALSSVGMPALVVISGFLAAVSLIGTGGFFCHSVGVSISLGLT
jgi:hypothetical protein